MIEVQIQGEYIQLNQFLKKENITGTVENFYAPPIFYSLLLLPRANTIMNLVFISFMHDFYFYYMPMNP